MNVAIINVLQCIYIKKAKQKQGNTFIFII